MDRIEGFHDLIARARAGERTATDELLGLVRPWIEQAARNHCPPQSPNGSVSDLVQEAWLRAWQKLDQFQGTADEAQSLAMFRAWLARIVARLGLNAARDAGAQQRTPPGKLVRLNGVRPADSSLPVLDLSSSEPTPSANLREKEQASRVQDALARLADPLDREIIRLRFFEGLSLRQVAHRLDCNHETVRQRYHAILGRLQQDLKGLE
jgi:RNA polymerase sigma-70 factor (ECF subfamily)